MFFYILLMQVKEKIGVNDFMISIAMATYNGEKYLREQLDSILAQTITDWELIICDDCSKDSTVELLTRYQRKDDRIKIFVNEKNLGFKKNFEKAIGLCSGDYIALADQDDIWHENHLEVLQELIGDASLSCGNASLMTADSVVTEKKLNVIDHLLFIPTKNEKLLYRILFISDPFQGASMLIKKQFLSKILPIPEGVLYHDAWIAACACFEKGIAYTFEQITDYRQHENNVTVAAQRLSVKKKSFIHKCKQGFKVLFSKKILYTDRFFYLAALSERYGDTNEDLCKIRDAYKNRHTNKLKVILFLWKNWFYISTTKSYKGFFPFVFTFFNLRPYNE